MRGGCAGAPPPTRAWAARGPTSRRSSRYTLSGCSEASRAATTSPGAFVPELMSSVRANGIDIWYEILGSSPGRPLVLTHGFAGPSTQWKPEILPLAEKRTLVLYDVRGHGRTSVPHPYKRKMLEIDDRGEVTLPQDDLGYSMPVFAADLAA